MCIIHTVSPIRPQSLPVSCVHTRCDLTQTAPAASPSRSSSWSGTPPGPLSPSSSPCWGSSPRPSSSSLLSGTTTRPSCGRLGGRWATCCWRESSCATPSPSWWSPHQTWECAPSGGFSWAWGCVSATPPCSPRPTGYTASLNKGKNRSQHPGEDNTRLSFYTHTLFSLCVDVFNTHIFGCVQWHWRSL